MSRGPVPTEKDRIELMKRLSANGKRRPRILSSSTAMAAVGFASVLASLIPSTWELFYKRTDTVTIEDRIRELSESLLSATETITQIENEINKRQELVVDLEAKAKLATDLYNTNRGQLDAVAAVLRGELARDERSTFWWGVGQNIVFMILGAFLGHYIERFMSRKKKEERFTP